ncbi:hypothetical protein CXG81DRAFT_26482 [Caulochytrium protostelioides]|uniref:Uncharacterized protein n=1 Tax=Caulochytrium protostelioides TaxID=1555241 RepID=A0A4P9X6J3_9FUNG|nr:hypothetical protein CXG81DRAFT_26482 [Caulochytrium protostelioides]|eukprot:RKP00817.1 hypothetical protein CXG81DRAFT_26482 [Caulochytrium protostelioides]
MAPMAGPRLAASPPPDLVPVFVVQHPDQGQLLGIDGGHGRPIVRRLLDDTLNATQLLAACGVPPLAHAQHLRCLPTAWQFPLWSPPSTPSRPRHPDAADARLSFADLQGVWIPCDVLRSVLLPRLRQHGAMDLRVLHHVEHLASLPPPPPPITAAAATPVGSHPLHHASRAPHGPVPQGWTTPAHEPPAYGAYHPSSPPPSRAGSCPWPGPQGPAGREPRPHHAGAAVMGPGVLATPLATPTGMPGGTAARHGVHDDADDALSSPSLPWPQTSATDAMSPLPASAASQTAVPSAARGWPDRPPPPPPAHPPAHPPASEAPMPRDGADAVRGSGRPAADPACGRTDPGGVARRLWQDPHRRPPVPSASDPPVRAPVRAAAATLPLTPPGWPEPAPASASEAVPTPTGATPAPHPFAQPWTWPVSPDHAHAWSAPAPATGETALPPAAPWHPPFPPTAAAAADPAMAPPTTESDTETDARTATRAVDRHTAPPAPRSLRSRRSRAHRSRRASTRHGCVPRRESAEPPARRPTSPSPSPSPASTSTSASPRPCDLVVVDPAAYGAASSLMWSAQHDATGAWSTCQPTQTAESAESAESVAPSPSVSLASSGSGRSKEARTGVDPWKTVSPYPVRPAAPPRCRAIPRIHQTADAAPPASRHAWYGASLLLEQAFRIAPKDRDGHLETEVMAGRPWVADGDKTALEVLAPDVGDFGFLATASQDRHGRCDRRRLAPPRGAEDAGHGQGGTARLRRCPVLRSAADPDTATRLHEWLIWKGFVNHCLHT